MQRIALAVVAAACATGCVSLPKFRAGAPVEPEKKALGHVYKQDGKAVDLGSLMAGLEGVEASRAEARSARGYVTGANVLGAIGGVGIGYGLVTGLGGEDSGWAIAGVGLGVAAIGIAVAAVADGHLARAVQAYNGTLGPAPRSSLPAIVPWLAPVPGTQDRCVAGGIAFRF